MSPATMLLAILGLTGFAGGAVLSATGQKEMGVVLMGAGLLFQMISLVRLKRAKLKGGSNAGG